MIKKHLCSALIVLFAVVTLVGCMKKAEPLPPQDLTHVVSYQGETLGAISEWYTGSVGNWKLIQAANPNLKVNRIKMGTEIVIPGDLLVTDARPPRNAIAISRKGKPNSEPKKKVSKAPVSKPPVVENAKVAKKDSSKMKVIDLSKPVESEESSQEDLEPKSREDLYKELLE